MNCFCDYDPPEFWSSKTPAARKERLCEECRRPIRVGERYEAVAGKWDGNFDTFATCRRCVDLRTWVKNSVPCFCWAHGNMWEDARDACFEAYYRAPDEAAGLRFGVLRRQELIRRGREISPRPRPEPA